VMDPETKRWRILGIVSGAIINDGHCDDTKFSLFTNVVLFLDWINQNAELDVTEE
jgi:hypothetical protein